MPAAPTSGPWPYPLIHEERSNRTPEWQELQRSGTGDKLRVVEWDPVSDTIRVTGPVVLNNPPHAPAP